MKLRLKSGVLCASVMLSCFQLSSLAVAGTRQVAPGPVPAQISMAKKIFIANAGENQPFLNDPIFTGGPQRAYDEFYAAMKASGRYELAGAPADADLSFEIELAVNRAGPRISQEPNLFGDIPYDPYFRLVIRDSKTNGILWVVIEHVQWAILQGNRDKNFDQAIDRIVSDAQWTTRSAAESAAKP
jgi:hypothetical protein